MKEELLIELGLKIKDLLIEYKANQFTWEEIKARIDTEYKLLIIKDQGFEIKP